MISSRLRTASGFVALVALMMLGVVTPRWGQVELRGVVEADARFTLTETEGQLRWVLRRGVAPAGLGVESEGVLQLDRGELANIDLAPGIAGGERVEEGALLLVGSSARVDAARDALLAEWDVRAARRDLLLSGGRSEAVVSANRAVDVAEANLAAAEIIVARLEGLVAAAAGARAELDDAKALVEVRRSELSRARAELALARLPARPEELAEAEALLAGVEAELTELDARAEAMELRSPIDGVLVRNTGDQNADAVLLEVISEQRSYARMPLPEAERGAVAVGDTFEFRPAVDPKLVLEARVVDIAHEATALQGRAVIWVVAELPAVLPPGSTGEATLGGPLG